MIFSIFGARHKMRKAVTRLARPRKEKIKKKTYRTPWGDLLKYVFKFEAGSCDHCGTKLVLVACITSRFTCKKILEHLKLPNEEVVVAYPRGPPELEFFDQSFSDF